MTTRVFILLVLGVGCCSIARASETVDYLRDVYPIFETYCVACHADADGDGNLAMNSHENLMMGGENGSVITPGVPASSRLYLMAAGKMEPLMPPDGEQGPSEEELAKIADWIEQGAIGPQGGMPIKRQLNTPDVPTTDAAPTPITAITTSEDGRLIAVAKYQRVEIQTVDGILKQTLDGDFGKVNSVRFNRDGSKVLIASGVTGAYGDASIYSIETGQREVEMIGHRDVLYSAIFSPDEAMIATAGYDRDIVLWDAKTGNAIRSFTGHNGAIFDLAFSPDGKVVASACADETVKIWNVQTGQRLDTLSQPEGEVFAVDFTADGKHVIAASGDNRLRVWQLRSIETPRINPIIATRFVDESPLVNFASTTDGTEIVVLSEVGNLKRIRTSDWTQTGNIEPVGGGANDLTISPDGYSLRIAMMDGTIQTRELPAIETVPSDAPESIDPIYLDLDALSAVKEVRPGTGVRENDVAWTAQSVGRGVQIEGAISAAGEVDRYRWYARRGEVWAIDGDPLQSDGCIDPIVTIVDDDGEPVLRVRMQAIRDTYFTFRGKDSSQVNDFRMFNWEELNLDDYLYAAGEVTRLFMHPRGPDSGFNVYPNEGKRWTYFGTTHATHALGEPAYIVRPIRRGAEPLANGLPVFDLFYENDDDPSRLVGTSSRLLFTCPADGHYTVCITDTRGEGGAEYGYELAIRAAAPAFVPHVQPITRPIRRGSGREFTVKVDRIDGFDGPVTFEVDGLPDGAVTNFPITIESET